MVVLVGSRDRVDEVGARRCEAVDGVIRADEVGWQKLKERRALALARAGHRPQAATGRRVLVGSEGSTRDKKIATYNLLTKDGGHEKRAYY